MFNSGRGTLDQGFRLLYDETFTMLYRVAVRITYSEEAAEDLVHDSYIKALERWDIFPSRDDAKYWLIRVVKNNALNWIKRKGREQKVYQRYFRERDDKSESPEDETIKLESSADVKASLGLLPEKFKTVLVLKEYAGLNYKEIGKVLGITEGNVKVRVFRAREALAELMREESGNVPGS